MPREPRSQQLVARRRWRLLFLADRAGDLREIARLAEVLVDAGEADVGDVVDRLEAVHHRFADSGRRDLVAAGFELALDRGDEPVDAVGRDVALAAGDGD